MMNVKRVAKVDSNFIGIYDGYILPVECEKVIKFYDHKLTFNDKMNRQQGENKISKILKEDETSPLGEGNINIWYDQFKVLFANFDIALKHYIEHTNLHDYYGGNSSLVYEGIKIQKTLPGGGYHVWHIEHGGSYPNRVLTYIIYLNDIEEGGETELLHKRVRIKPKTGRIVIFPAGFPYVHRGNPPLTGVKYILTSWINTNYPEIKFA
jgi:hypothetical protein